MIFLEQFKDLLVIILIIAAIISMTTGNVESTAVIIAVLILNAILGTVQYVKAEKSLESLKEPVVTSSKGHQKRSAPRNRRQRPCLRRYRQTGSRRRRSGRRTYDRKLFSESKRKLSFTGESEGVDKRTEVIDGDAVALGDQINMVFSGSFSYLWQRISCHHRSRRPYGVWKNRRSDEQHG